MDRLSRQGCFSLLRRQTLLIDEIKTSGQGGAWGIWYLTEDFVADETEIVAKVTLERNGSSTYE